MRREDARLLGLTVDGPGRAWAACARGKEVKLYRLGPDGPELVLAKDVPSSSAVFILKERTALVHVDARGGIRVWPYGP